MNLKKLVIPILLVISIALPMMLFITPSMAIPNQALRLMEVPCTDVIGGNSFLTYFHGETTPSMIAEDDELYHILYTGTGGGGYIETARFGFDTKDLGYVKTSDVYSLTASFILAFPQPLLYFDITREIRLVSYGDGGAENIVYKASVLSTEFFLYQVTILQPEIVNSMDGDGIVWFELALNRTIPMTSANFDHPCPNVWGKDGAVDYVSFFVLYRAFENNGNPFTGVSLADLSWDEDAITNRFISDGFSHSFSPTEVVFGDDSTTGTNTLITKIPEFTNYWLYQQYTRDFSEFEFGFDFTLLRPNMPDGGTDNVTVELWAPNFGITMLDPSYALIPTHVSFTIHWDKHAYWTGTRSVPNFWIQHEGINYTIPEDMKWYTTGGAELLGTMIFRYTADLDGIHLNLFMKSVLHDPSLPIIRWGKDSVFDLSYLTFDATTMGVDHYLKITHEENPNDYLSTVTFSDFYGYGVDLNPLDRFMLVMFQIFELLSTNLTALVGLVSLAVGGLTIGLLKLKSLALPVIASAGSIGIGLIGALFIGAIFPIATMFVSAFAMGTLGATGMKRVLKNKKCKDDNKFCEL